MERAAEKNTAAQSLLTALAAFAVVLALHVNYEVVEGLETGSALLNLFSRIPNSFTTGLFTDALSFAAVYLLLRYAGRDGGTDAWTGALAVIFALFYTAARSCMAMGSLKFFTANLYQLCLASFTVAGCAIFFCALLKVLYRLADTREWGQDQPVRHPFRTAAAVILLCWLPWLLMNYPCSFNPDSIDQLQQWTGAKGWSAHHPPFSTAVMGLCYSLGRSVWNANFGCFLYTVLQSLCGASVFAAALSELYRMSASRKLYAAGLIFYAAVPVWGCFAQWFEKDLLYAEVFMLVMVLIVRMIRERKCTLATAGLAAIATSSAVLLRKTGTYELIPGLVILALYLKRGDRIRLLAAALAALLLSGAVNKVLYPALGIEDASVKEALSIPFQQTARYVMTYPEEVTPEEKAAIDAVLVYDELDKYNPEISDYVKNNYREDASKLPQYFDAWFHMFLKHPGVYVEAVFVKCYGYIAPVRVALDAYILSSYYEEYCGPLEVYRVFGDSPTRYFDSIREMFTTGPLTKYLCMAGFYTWVLMACFVQLLRRKKYAVLIAFVPVVMNVLICVASPLCSSTRYELPSIAAAPLLLGLTALLSRPEREITET